MEWYNIAVVIIAGCLLIIDVVVLIAALILNHKISEELNEYE